MAAIAGVKGQYYFNFELDGAGDFLGREGKIHSFYMIEEIGGNLPIFKLVFSSNKFDVIKNIHEGSNITVEFGKDVEETKQAEMVIQKNAYRRVDSDFFIVTIEGMLRVIGKPKNTSQYMSDVGQKSYEKKTSMEVMMEEAEEFFEIIDETDPELEFEDKYNWLKMGKTSKEQIDYVWKHSRIADENNFLTYGIDFAGNWIVTDLKMLLTRPVFFKLTQEPSENPDWAAFDPGIEPESDFGLMNHLSLYTKKGFYFDPNKDEGEVIESPELNPSFTDGVNVMRDQPITFENPTIFDFDNVHDNYNKVRYSNTARSVLQDSLELNVIIENKWVDYGLLYLIEFDPNRPMSPSLYEAETAAIGGIYVITRINRFFENNRAAIQLTISRDGMSGTEGAGLMDLAGGFSLGNIVNILF